jgi:hypothetical protein
MVAITTKDGSHVIINPEHIVKIVESDMSDNDYMIYFEHYRNITISEETYYKLFNHLVDDKHDLRLKPH